MRALGTLALGAALAMSGCSGTRGAVGEGPAPRAIAEGRALTVDPDASGAQLDAFLAAFRRGESFALCGITSEGGEFDEFDRDHCLVTEGGKALLARPIGNGRYTLRALRHVRGGRFALVDGGRIVELSR